MRKILINTVIKIALEEKHNENMTNIFVDDILFICVVSLSFVFHIISPFVRIFPIKKYSFALRICFDMAKFGRCIN